MAWLNSKTTKQRKTMTLYTTKTCGFCPTVKKILDMKNKDYETVDVTDDYDSRLELQQKYGAMTVPVLVSDKGVMIGFNQAKLFSLI